MSEGGRGRTQNEVLYQLDCHAVKFPKTGTDSELLIPCAEKLKFKREKQTVLLKFCSIIHARRYLTSALLNYSPYPVLRRKGFLLKRTINCRGSHTLFFRITVPYSPCSDSRFSFPILRIPNILTKHFVCRDVLTGTTLLTERAYSKRLKLIGSRGHVISVQNSAAIIHVCRCKEILQVS
jgi:hypothetical protein